MTSKKWAGLCLAVIWPVVAVGAGCGGSQGSEESRSTGETTAGKDAPVFVRGCGARVGDGRLSHSPGDLTLRNIRIYSADQHAPVRSGGIFDSGKRLSGKWRAFKTLLILNGPGATLRVPARERQDFLLAYDPARTRNFAYFRSDGQAAVRFVNCSPPRSDLEFSGSLIARRPGCYRVQEVSRNGMVLASGVVNIAMGRGACGRHGRLSGRAPQSVRAACRRAQREVTSLDFVCPPLVPSGPARVQAAYLEPEFFALDFASRSIAEHSGAKLVYPGHWLIQGGTPEAISQELRANSPNGLPEPSRRFEVSGLNVSLYRIDGYQNVHAGHDVVTWEFMGAMYVVSVHGTENGRLALAMARPMIRAMVRSGPAS